MKFDIPTMQARFHELKQARDDIRAKSGPLRANRDAIEQRAKAECDLIDAKVRKVEALLNAIKEELAVIARALGGKTGSP